MNLSELLALLERHAAHPELVCVGIGHPIDDDGKLHIVNDNGRWQVYHVERGHKTLTKIFSSEDEACAYLFELIRQDGVVWGTVH